jgi:hypothetical protein
MNLVFSLVWCEPFQTCLNKSLIAGVASYSWTWVNNVPPTLVSSSRAMIIQANQIVIDGCSSSAISKPIKLQENYNLNREIN